MRAGPLAVLDACVLANYAVADLLLRLAERPRLYRPAWSADVLDEVHRTQVGPLGWPPELADSFGAALRAHFPEALVTGYGPLVAGMANDPKDRHVLAAAVHVGAEAVVTFNLRDFPAGALAPWGVEAVHPGPFLAGLYGADPGGVMARVGAIAERRGEPAAAVLGRLRSSVPAFADRALGELGGSG